MVTRPIPLTHHLSVHANNNNNTDFCNVSVASHMWIMYQRNTREKNKNV